MTDQNQHKRKAAEEAASRIESGMRVGLGTGSTAAFMVEFLGQRIKEGLTIAGAVSTSEKTKLQAEKLGIPLASLDELPELDLTLDGADEIDPNFNLIKGGGGALLREKIVASASKRLIIMADPSKRVDVLGAFKLPIEIIKFAQAPVTRRVVALGGTAVLRTRNGQPFVTDEGNAILDCDFGAIQDPGALAEQLSATPGVVEHGLFVQMADEIIIGGPDGVQTQSRSR